MLFLVEIFKDLRFCEQKERQGHLVCIKGPPLSGGGPGTILTMAKNNERDNGTQRYTKKTTRSSCPPVRLRLPGMEAA